MGGGSVGGGGDGELTFPNAMKRDVKLLFLVKSDKDILFFLKGGAAEGLHFRVRA